MQLRDERAASRMLLAFILALCAGFALLAADVERPVHAEASDAR